MLQSIPPTKNSQIFLFDGLFIRMNKAPFLIAQVVKLREGKAIFEAPKKKQYCQIPGYHIYLVEKGFDKKPGGNITTQQIQKLLCDMGEWYYDLKIKNNRIIKKIFHATTD